MSQREHYVASKIVKSLDSGQPTQVILITLELLSLDKTCATKILGVSQISEF